MANRSISEARVLAGTRTSVTNRQMVRDFGTCTKLDGVTGLVVYTLGAGIPVLPSEAFSLSFWAKVHAGASGNTLWAEARTSSAFGPDFQISQTAGGKVSLFVRNDANTTEKNVASTLVCLKYDKWQHFCYTQSIVGSDAVVNMYVDGVVVSGSTDWNYGFTGVHTLNTFSLGGRVRSTTGLFQNMSLDEVALIKGRALSLAEVQNIFYRGIYPSDNKTIYTKFDENTGTTSTDSSGNGNTATLTGAGATWSSDKAMTTRSVV